MDNDNVEKFKYMRSRIANIIRRENCLQPYEINVKCSHFERLLLYTV